MSLKHLAIGAVAAVCTFVAGRSEKQRIVGNPGAYLHQQSRHPRCPVL